MMKKGMKYILMVFVSTLAVLQLSVQAGPISLTSSGYTQDFNTLMNSGTVGGGTVPDDAELTAAFFGSADSGWWNGSGQSFASATTGDLANSMRMLSFGTVDGDSERSIAAGRQGSSEAYGAQFQNDTGGTLTELAIQYDGEQWYHGGGGSTLSFFYSTDATGLFDGTWTPVTSLNFNAPNNIGVWSSGDGNLAANRETISGNIEGLSIAAGATFFIRFGGDEANDDALAVDNFSITPGGPVPGPPRFITSPTVKSTAMIDVAYTGSLSNDVSEAEGDAITYTKLDGPDWLTIAPATGDLSGTPTIANSGPISSNNIFTVELSDIEGATTGEVHIVVSTGAGTPPSFTANPTDKPAATADEAYTDSLSGDIAEPDGDTVTFGKVTGPDWLTIEPATGDLSGTPGSGDVGANVFTVEVYDIDGASTGTVNITVAPAPPPDPGELVDVDVNWNIVHSVGGVSDFGRERHITVHSATTDPDWNGQEDKLDYLMNDLDVYFGRDNGSATWKFANTPQDPNRPNYADLTFVTNWSAWWDTQYDADVNRLQYEGRATEMIMGTNPHPVYPTLSWNTDGFTWTGWQPLEIESSVDYIVAYIDQAFRRGTETSGEQMPKYWEIINEPDMELMTGQFMVSSWEALFEYHNLVALGIKERMGADAPLIGGMTWGQHDFHIADGVSRYTSNFYYDLILGGDPTATDGAEFYQAAGYTKWPGAGAAWDQWDKIWQGFIDECGTNMDFYAVHIYDWPQRGIGSSTSRMRTGGHTEGMLDVLEWYDVYKFGEENRKPIVLSEYGSVGAYISNNKDGLYVDWECLRPWSTMMMQFLERPDYIVKSMPFTPTKAEWGNYYNADGSLLARYPYSMLDENPDGSDNWEWSGYILWFELWADVEGTRVETQASDKDILVDAYVNGDHAFLILNNMETTAATISLHEFGLGAEVESVRIKHLYCENYEPYSGTGGYGVLDDYMLQTAPGSIKIDPEATIILRYNFADTFTPGATLVESKVFGEKLGSGTNPRGGEMFRSTGASFSGNINGVTIPTGPAEAVLRIAGSFTEGSITAPRPGLDYIKINGNDLPFLTDWRGQEISAGGWGILCTLEIPVPMEYLQADNTITASFNNSANKYAALSLQIFDFSEEPGRYGETPTVSVSGMSITEDSISLNQLQEGTVTAVISPSNATVKTISWSSGNTSVATVDPNTGRITGAGEGSTTITAITVDGSYSDTVTVNVSASSVIAVESVRVNPANLTILLNESLTSVATVLPENADNKAVTWSSSDSSIATVSASGVISAVGAGVATITATTDDGGFTDTTVVTVPDPVAVTGVSLPPTALIVSGGTLQLTAAVSPANATYPSVTWESLTPAVATVNASGLVTAVGEGTAEIQVTTDEGGFTATCLATIFEVGPDGTNVVVEAEDLVNTGGVEISDIGINTVEAGDWAEYTVTVPENGIYKIVYLIASPEDGSAITFMLNGATVATDSVPSTGDWEVYNSLQSGGYVGLSAGSHTVRLQAGTKEWQWNLDKFTLTKVAEGGAPVAVESVSVNPTSSLIAAGSTTQLAETVLPVNASDTSVTWESSNPTVATVDADGLVSGLTEGSALIIVTTTDGGFAATNSLTVSPGASVDGVSVSPATGDVAVGSTIQLTETVSPSDALNKSVTWRSLSEKVASVDSSGLVTGESEGTAQIVVTTVDGGFSATNVMTVTIVHADSVSLPATATVGKGETTQLAATVLPADAINKSVTWESLNPSIATVDASGLVSGIDGGVATIVVTTVDGGHTATNQTIVTIEGPVMDISIVDGEVVVNVTNGTFDAYFKVLSNTNLVEGAGWQIIASNLTFDAAGEAVLSNSVDAADQIFYKIEEGYTSDGSLPTNLTIEAESYDSTGGGSYVNYSEYGGDGNIGVMSNGSAINFVQLDDWAEYENVELEPGLYQVEYFTGTIATTDPAIDLLIDGTTAAHDALPNNGDWDTYVSTVSSTQVEITSGPHTLRILANGTGEWQWNMDRFILTRVGDLP